MNKKNILFAFLFAIILALMNSHVFFAFSNQPKLLGLPSWIIFYTIVYGIFLGLLFNYLFKYMK